MLIRPFPEKAGHPRVPRLVRRTTGVTVPPAAIWAGWPEISKRVARSS